MANDLRILLTASLDSSKSITEINTAINNLEKKVNTLKLNIDIDDKVARTLSDFSKAMENHKKIAQDLNKVIKEEKLVEQLCDKIIFLKENIEIRKLLQKNALLNVEKFNINTYYFEFCSIIDKIIKE
jgi:uncharacterized coiled-coil DUF342 family protein